MAYHCGIAYLLFTQQPLVWFLGGSYEAAIKGYEMPRNYLDQSTHLELKKDTHKTREHFISRPFMQRALEGEEA